MRRAAGGRRPCHAIGEDELSFLKTSIPEPYTLNMKPLTLN